VSGSGRSSRGLPLVDGAIGPLIIIVLGAALIATALYSSVEVPVDAGLDAHDATAPPGAEPLVDGGDATSPRARELIDARTPAADASHDADEERGPLFGLTPHERDEIAKDEVARARALLRQGDLRSALDALDRAALHDPGNTDIAPLRREAQTQLAPQPEAGVQAAPSPL
jgi:hypothetical protein